MAPCEYSDLIIVEASLAVKLLQLADNVSTKDLDDTRSGYEEMAAMYPALIKSVLRCAIRLRLEVEGRMKQGADSASSAKLSEKSLCHDL
jgi:hypothetical protein